MSAIIVSLHDVAPATFVESRHWLRVVEAHDLKATLLVVPGPWRRARLSVDGEFVDWLRAAQERGHEVALHGWEHTAVVDPAYVPMAGRNLMGRLLARGCAEFWELSYGEARRRLTAGLEALSVAGIRPVGFTPPGWLASAEAMTAMADVGLAYTTTQRHIVDLRDNQRHPIFALSHRPGSSLSGAAASWVEMAASHRLHNSHPVRLALHPRDVDHPRLRAATDRVLDMAQRRGVVSSTYAGYLGVEYAVR